MMNKMIRMSKKIKVIFIFLVAFPFFHKINAEEIEQIVSGAEIENTLEGMKIEDPSPYIIKNFNDEMENKDIQKNSSPDYIFSNNPKELLGKPGPKENLQGMGYTTPGTFSLDNNYMEIDKSVFAAEVRKYSDGAINIAYIKNNFSYESQNDIINRTISEGHKHIKGGSLHLRADQYFFRRDFLNIYWAGGGGVGYNRGNGIFVTGIRSTTTFKLWEIPLDLGLGLEIPLYHWFKISATAGPSLMSLLQNRDDLLPGEDGRNKIQISEGYFGNAQFKINLSGFNSSFAYELFTESKITNLCLNLEARYQRYNHFQDNIIISGTSYGIGFTFEYL